MIFKNIHYYLFKNSFDRCNLKKNKNLLRSIRFDLNSILHYKNVQ